MTAEKFDIRPFAHEGFFSSLPLGDGMDPIDWHNSPQATVPGRLAEMVKRYAQRLALVGTGWQPTYAELHATVMRLAGHLHAHGGAIGDRVALLMRHDTPLIAAMLAVLQAGRIVVVLNPTDPPARLRQLLDDADPHAIITDSGRRELAAEIAGEHRSVIAYDEWAMREAAVTVPVVVSPDEVAFLIYTSGSTGQPKGVMRTHAAAVHQAYRIEHEMGLGAEDRITPAMRLFWEHLSQVFERAGPFPFLPLGKPAASGCRLAQTR